MLGQHRTHKEEVRIAYEVLQYLMDHPDAQDTLEGIVGWWLLERTVKQQTLSVKQALSILVADKLVLARRGVDTKIHYKINGRRRRKIMSLLREKYQKARSAANTSSV